MFQLGTVLRLKTTGESVVVIGDVPSDPDMVVVRRPTSTQAEGLRHQVDEFALYELDTVEESIRREFNEVKIRQALIEGDKVREAMIQ
jgi:hypothetical protein